MPLHSPLLLEWSLIFISGQDCSEQTAENYRKAMTRAESPSATALESKWLQGIWSKP